MKMHQVAASVLCMALLLALCLSVACSEEIMPFAESGNSVRAVLSFSGGKVIGESRVKKLEVGCTASTTVYVQARAGADGRPRLREAVAGKQALPAQRKRVRNTALMPLQRFMTAKETRSIRSRATAAPACIDEFTGRIELSSRYRKEKAGNYHNSRKEMVPLVGNDSHLLQKNWK